jgi:hypothetical protein
LKLRFIHGGPEQWKALIADGIVEILEHNLNLNFPSSQRPMKGRFDQWSTIIDRSVVI